MSLPRRTPPSQMISTRSPTASATGATRSNAAGAPSSWRPPWFDSAIASTPLSAAIIAFTASEHRGVDREHECLVARGSSASDHLLDEAAVAPRVHLEPEPSVGGVAHLFDRSRAERRQRVRKARASGGACDGQLAVG